jgi:hypothetical protein
MAKVEIDGVSRAGGAHLLRISWAGRTDYLSVDADLARRVGILLEQDRDHARQAPEPAPVDGAAVRVVGTFRVPEGGRYLRLDGGKLVRVNESAVEEFDALLDAARVAPAPPEPSPVEVTDVWTTVGGGRMALVRCGTTARRRENVLLGPEAAEAFARLLRSASAVRVCGVERNTVPSWAAALRVEAGDTGELIPVSPGTAEAFGRLLAEAGDLECGLKEMAPQPIPPESERKAGGLAQLAEFCGLKEMASQPATPSPDATPPGPKCDTADLIRLLREMPGGRAHVLPPGATLTYARPTLDAFQAAIRAMKAEGLSPEDAAEAALRFLGL